jgi:hypothetical protein
MPDSGLLVLARTRRERHLKNWRNPISEGDIVSICCWCSGVKTAVELEPGDLGLVLLTGDGTWLTVHFPSGPDLVSKHWLERAGASWRGDK